MSSKKISKDASRTISGRIAKKAFEHLIPALEEQVKQLGIEASEKLHSQIDASLLRKLNIVQGDTNTMRIWVYSRAEDLGNESRKVNLDGPGWSASHWNAVSIVDADLAARASVVIERLQDLCKKRSALAQELCEQCIGKTVKAALAAWPEAADIISDVTDVPLTQGFVSPLENLLAKFLPMLPAPAEA